MNTVRFRRKSSGDAFHSEGRVWRGPGSKMIELTGLQEKIALLFLESPSVELAADEVQARVSSQAVNADDPTAYRKHISKVNDAFGFRLIVPSGNAGVRSGGAKSKRASYRLSYDIEMIKTLEIEPELEGVQPTIEASATVDAGTTSVNQVPPPEFHLSHLPSVSNTLIGREDLLDQLDRAWVDPDIHLVSIVAFGGVGKTALAINWLHSRGATGASRILGWSAGSQGTGEQKHASADIFLDYALRQWFGVQDPPHDAWGRGELLAKLLRRERALLILDGLEPLQFPPGPQGGFFRDRGILALVKELAAQNRGLCICTSRYPLIDLEDYQSDGVYEIDLKNLLPEDGARYLRTLGVEGEESELKAASAEFGNHALALTLLGSLIRRWGGDVRRRDMIPSVFEAKQGGHARRIMREYEVVFDGKAELDVLRILGLFDRSADNGAIKAVKKILYSEWVAALENLADARLIQYEHPDRSIDCHPLVREHFEAEFKHADPEGFASSHDHLYKHYSALAPQRPDTIQEMEPLFFAVRHGCLAGRHQEVWSDVYVARLLRGESEYYLTQKLGELGLSLSIIAEFFNKPWRELVPGLDLNTRLWVLGEAGFTLTILRRLADAIQPLEAAVEGYEEAKGWENASLCSNNLSELYLHLGRIPQAIQSARSAVSFADESGVTLCRMGCRATLGHALHQAGRFEEAKVEFERGENIQAEAEPERPYLYGQPLFQYCDLLLDQGLCEDVIHRIDRSRKFSFTLLFEAMDLLAVGRALKPGTQESAQELDKAVSTFRRSEQLDQLPLALLARASDSRLQRDFESAAKDLNEVQKLTERPGMLLHLADFNIEYARLLLDEGNLNEAQLCFVEAKRIVKETGYNRRLSDIADLNMHFTIK